MNSLLRIIVALVVGIGLYDYLHLIIDVRITDNQYIPTSEIKHQPSAVYASAMILGFGLLFLCLLVSLFYKKTSRYAIGFFLITSSICLGFLLRFWNDETQDPIHISHFDLKQLSAYEAVVLSPAERKSSSYKIEVQLRQGRINNRWQPLRGKIVVYLHPDAPIPHYGEGLVVEGAPQLVKPPANPDQFAHDKFLSYRHIYFQQYLKTNDFRLSGHNDSNWLKTSAYRLSQWSDVQLQRLIPWSREYAVTKAMVLGIRDEMDHELTQAYSTAGAVHVLSVSGFHIAIFIWILSTLLSRLEKKRYGRWLYLVITLGAMWFYAILTGLSTPVIRSAVMFTIFLMAKPLHKKENALQALYASALVLLCYDPLLIYSVSFQLSYAALGGIILLQPALYQSITFNNKLFDKLWEITAVALTAQLTTFPLVVYYFHQLPSYFWLANPAVVGLAFLQLPAALATVSCSYVPFLGEFLGWVTTLITWLLNEAIVQTDRLPASKLTGISFGWLEVAVCYLLMWMLAMLWQSRNKQWLWAAACLSLGLMGWQMIETNKQNNQKLIVVHAIPQHTAVSMIEGRSLKLLADSAFLADKRSFNFYLGNFYAKRGINNITLVALENPSQSYIRPLDFGKIVSFQHQNLLIIEKPIETIPATCDWILVTKNAVKEADILPSNQPIVFDNSNKWYITKPIYERAILQKLPQHISSEEGAKVIEW